MIEIKYKHLDIVNKIQGEIEAVDAEFGKFGPHKHLRALLAVAELHKPDDNGKCNADFPTLYPCRTIETIGKELA